MCNNNARFNYRVFYKINYKLLFMDKVFKDKIEKRLNQTGIKKSFLAEKVGISKSQLSQCFSGSRKLKPEEETKIRITLNL